LRGYLRHLLQDQFNDLCLFFGIIQLAFVNAERFRSLYQRSDFRGLELCELSREQLRLGRRRVSSAGG
jgi:hypothetical protein